tara:strand:- start:8733 stop:9365 length:633 start_codon:yes stop_codon:yes gene_type:complete
MRTIILFLISPVFAHAMQSEVTYDDYYSYDNIVDQLKTERPAEEEYMKDYEDIYFHVGAGFTQSILNAKSNTASDTVTMNGIEIKGAINLMSPFWLAEGSIRNFNSTRDSKATYKLREFELRITRLTPMSRVWFNRVTTGLSTRFLESNLETRSETKDYSTPSLILGGGLGFNLNERMALVGDLAFKTSMIDDTIDKNVFDLTVRLDTRF